MKLTISAIVVSHNEGHLLDACLSSISFCQEIIVANMASEDETASIAANHDCQLIEVPYCNVVEQIYGQVISKAKHDWILLIDPDERFTPHLQKALGEFFKNEITEKTALIQLPWQFFFDDRKLAGTVWGGKRFKKSILHKKRVILSDYVHRSLEVKPGFEENQIGGNEQQFLEHRWAQSFDQLFQKHRRYLKEEGRSLYENGLRYDSFFQQLRKSLFAFKDSFYTKRGYRDGLTGLLLSLFWMWYVFNRWSALKKYQQTQPNA